MVLVARLFHAHVCHRLTEFNPPFTECESFGIWHKTLSNSPHKHSKFMHSVSMWHYGSLYLRRHIVLFRQNVLLVVWRWRNLVNAYLQRDSWRHFKARPSRFVCHSLDHAPSEVGLRLDTPVARAIRHSSEAPLVPAISRSPNHSSFWLVDSLISRKWNQGFFYA
jgi:hypothetical protein